jgi:hypothetical protein
LHRTNGRRKIIEYMRNFERVQMCALEHGQLVVEWDVSLGHVGIEQHVLHSVCQVIEHVVEELV